MFNKLRSLSKVKVRGFFWKFMLLLIELFGMYHIHLSYKLSEQGFDTCSDISSQIILYMVAPFITCIISKTVENVFEHNKLSFSEPINLDDQMGG